MSRQIQIRSLIIAILVFLQVSHAFNASVNYQIASSTNIINYKTADSKIPIEEYETDPYTYIDDDGTQKKIKDVKDQFYYNRLHTVKLEGSTGETVYWVNLYVGSPPQRQTAIIDTGSSLLAFPCSDCRNGCGSHINKQYNLTSSSTSNIMKCGSQFDNFSCSKCSHDNICEWGVHYQEGSSISGFMALDYVVFGDEIQEYIHDKSKNNLTEQEDYEYLKFINHERVRLPFGCTTRETHLFRTQKPDGIIGLAPSSNSQYNPPNIIDRIFASHKDNDEELVFSLCLNSHEGGYMSIGGYNHELHQPGAKTQIISFSPNHGFYDVSVKSVRMGGKVVTTHIPNAILDSGTTVVFGPHSFIQPMIQEINYLCNNQKDKYKCGNAKERYNPSQSRFQYIKSEEFPTVQDFFDSFPSFEFDFETDDGPVSIEWKAHGYFYVDPENRNPNLYQFAFESFPSNKVYLGGPFMKNYDILFDKTKKKIHFTASNCTLPHINSVLMNQHTQKIKKTVQDVKFIKDLQDFQNKINYTIPLFNDTKTTNDTKKIEDKKQIKDNNNIQADKYLKILIVVLFALISLVVICLLRKPKIDNKDLIPLQSIEGHHQQVDDSVHQPADQDEQLQSEEDNPYGYKNDPTYQQSDLEKQTGLDEYGNDDNADEENQQIDALQE